MARVLCFRPGSRITQRFLERKGDLNVYTCRKDRGKHMKTIAFMALGFGFLTLAVQAQEKPSQLDATTPKSQYLDWQDPEWWQRDWNREEMKLSVGKSDYVVQGPLVETFTVYRRSDSQDRSLGQKILNLPIVNLFVPQPIAKPTGREGKYLAWGQRDQPWSTLADRGIPGPVGLMSVSW